MNQHRSRPETIIAIDASMPPDLDAIQNTYDDYLVDRERRERGYRTPSKNVWRFVDSAEGPMDFHFGEDEQGQLLRGVARAALREPFIL